MIAVYVWQPKRLGSQKNVGHAAMLVAGRVYVSWWPDEDAGLGRDFYPIRNKSYKSDVADEGSAPDNTVHLQGLDEESILKWWASFGLVTGNAVLQGPLPAYNLVKQNCSTVVATGLKKGGGDKFAPWYSSWSIIWRPRTVLEYALAMKEGLARTK